MNSSTRLQLPKGGRCATQKRRFRDHKEAIGALHGAQAYARLETEACGESRRAECRVYECFSCKGWHLTSKPTMTVGAERSEHA